MIKLKQARQSFIAKLMCALFTVTLMLTVGSIRMYAETTGSEGLQQSVRTVKGTVKDNSGNPLIGVTVFVKGTTTGTITDVDGKYSLPVQEGQTLDFTYVGFKSISIDTANKDEIHVVMEEDSQMMEEVVVVGFGVQKKENLTGAVTSVDVSKAIDSKPIVDVEKALQGIAPGLTITYNSGNLGAEATMRLRGAGTIINGKAAGSPLVLVDGAPTSLSMINPADIATISVLKDAASASIYGTQGAFGVILITTKSGQSDSNKITFSYSNNFAYSKPSNLIGFVDPEEELGVMIDASLRTKGEIGESFGMYHDKLLAGIKRWKENYASSRTRNNKEMIYGEDWEIIDGRAYTYRIWEPHEEMLRDWTPQMTHNLSAQGRLSNKSTFLISLGYVAQSGFMRINTDKMKRYNANFSLTTQLTSWLKSTVGFMYSRRDLTEPYNYYNSSGINIGTNTGARTDGQNGYFGYYMRWGKYFPFGTYNGVYFRHAPGFMNAASKNKNQNDFMRISANLVADITKDLTFNVEYRFTTNNNNLNINGHPVQLLDFWSSGWDPNDIMGTAITYSGTTPGGSHDKVAERISKRENHVFNAYATYTKTFAEDHNVKAMVGTNIEKNEFRRRYLERRNVMDPSMSDINLAVGDQFVTSTWNALKPAHNEYAIAGFFGRVNYDYRGRYLFEFNGRYDGASKFPRHKLWGFFPSASVGYRITEESFMEPVKSVANDIKIRASVGSIGNQEVGDNMFRAMMDIESANWIYNGTQASTVETAPIVDPNLSWEKIITYDVGADVRFLNSMIGVTFDWYRRYNKDMLAVGRDLPKTVGTDPAYTNAGEMQTTGYEIGVDFNLPINKNVMIYATASLSDYQQKITKWDNPTKRLGTFYEGMKVGEIWGFETDRLFTEADFTTSVDGNGKTIYTPVAGIPDQSKLISGNFKQYQPGDVKYKNLDGDDIISAGELTAEEPGDLKVIGNTTPRYEYSFRLGANFYGFDVDIFFQGVGKRDFWASSDMVLPLYNRTDALYEKQMDFWSTDNPDGFYPRPFFGHAANAIGSGVTGSNNFITQSRYLLDMSYLRLKNITVGYTLPIALTKKVGIDKARVYFSGQNIAEFKSSRLPVDPEIDDTEASWGRAYPYPRTLSVGLQVNF